MNSASKLASMEKLTSESVGLDALTSRAHSLSSLRTSQRFSAGLDQRQHRSITSSIDSPVVSISTASSARGQRRRASRAVAAIARFERRRDIPTMAARRAERVGRIVRAAPGALLGRGIEIDLHVRVGKHHRPDVAPLHDDPARATHLALLRDEDFADARLARHGGCRGVDFRRPDRARHVVAIDRHDAVADDQLRPSRASALACSSVRSTPSCRAFHATARYIAPVSMWR